MESYKFSFDPKSCNKIYFKELFLLLNAVKPKEESFNRIKQSDILKLNIRCESKFNSCSPDEFFFENKKQIILGRFVDTIGCFYRCKGSYFSMAMEPYSMFRNDLFIRFIIDKPELYINNSNKIDLEHVFPIRVVMNEKYIIPAYAETKMESIKEYTFDIIKSQIAVSKTNLKIINKLPDTSILKQIVSSCENPVIARELCILYYMKLYFYIVKNTDKTVKPFILVSKYNLKQLKKIYNDYKKPMPNIVYLFRK